jgi:hypothetical protein
MPLAGCRIFDGIDDWAGTTGNLDLSPYPAVTVLARVWWDEWGGLRWVFEHSLNTTTQAGGFIVGNYYDAAGTWAVAMSSVGVPPSLPIHLRKLTVPPTLGVWHALGVVFDRSKTGAQEIAVYLDGVLVDPTWISAPSIGPGTQDV